MIKVAIVLMKGFDGCGVSRFAIEHQKQLRENGDICDVYSYSLSRYIREASHKDKDIIKYENFTDLDFSSYDILILNSYEQEFKEESIMYNEKFTEESEIYYIKIKTIETFINF